MKKSTKDILKRVEKLLEAGYKQILIKEDIVYASGGINLITEKDLETPYHMIFNEKVKNIE